ncbi:MAG: class I SAM-dependent methyltransferase [Paenibacillus macerans]|uniref:Ribosomal RNA adenine dimethylase family protein n=1 Tax=Paenibacillus macerans TaxID=44252 RepID=A0A090ZDU7_PAEMA|nr:class I SAM-dependent methyltransferase [Paenibacillus macerans]KFN08400.1 ribosomal RNA adenine dimethylase family protein [Paenibacillus macerans]MBS5914640.1 class I SAM-dependent methyltransferase [Paenibacillus macerans]MCY7559510.1 class I SAM-dependent methyltransferase [Paenibacillus macerans]MDU7473563.1 class I SAM-dependent methyltransferase [Paenibacillus macerans]MEC0136196.1 class I SAM-dependent methyltransferase [Paenibacillus macerans]
MRNDFFNEAAWEQAWKEDTHTAVNKMKNAGIDPVRTFDDKAKSFNEQAFNEEGRQRARRIMNWLEGQGVTFKDNTILDIGAASGGFTVPFAERGARVTSVEPNLSLSELLRENIAGIANGKVDVVAEPFEDIDIQAKGWEKAFDFVFVSMCPVIVDWESVEKVLSCARKFCYISLSAGSREHSLVNEIWPLVTDQPMKNEHLEMAYLLHLLYLKGYSYESLVTKELKTTELSREAALQEVMNWLKMFNLPADDRSRNIVADYLERTYPADKVEIRQGGRFGKVLIRLQDQNMYTRERP